MTNRWMSIAEGGQNQEIISYFIILRCESSRMSRGAPGMLKTSCLANSIRQAKLVISMGLGSSFFICLKQAMCNPTPTVNVKHQPVGQRSIF
jgi:hypothetical protein